MKKTTTGFLMIASTTILCLCVAAGFMLNENSTQLKATSDYSLAITPSESGTYTKTSLAGYQINFNVSNMSSGILASGGYIANSDKIIGLKTITINYSLTSDTTLTIYVGTLVNGTLVYDNHGISKSVLSSANSTTFSFSTSQPNYFKLVSGGAITISSIEFAYSCADSGKSYITPTADEVLRKMRSYLGYSSSAYTYSSTSYNGRGSRCFDLVKEYASNHNLTVPTATYSPVFIESALISAGGGFWLNTCASSTNTFISKQGTFISDVSSYVPQKGDIIVHVNDGNSLAIIDEVVSDSAIYVLEGNNSRSIAPLSTTTTAGRVSRLTLAKSDITSYWRPAYNTSTELVGVGAQDILTTMRGWMGITETNSRHQEIIDVYDSVSPLPRSYTVAYGDEWCDTTVSTASIVSGATALTSRECGVQVHASIMHNSFGTNANGTGWHPMEELYDYTGSSYSAWSSGETIYTFSSTNLPKTGDIILYDWGTSNDGTDDHHADHIGYIENVEEANSYINTIEGNASSRVFQRRYGYSSSYWAGYFRPSYTSTRTHSNRDLLNVVRSYLGDYFTTDSSGTAAPNERYAYLTDALDSRLRIDSANYNYASTYGVYNYAAYALVSALYISGLNVNYGIDIPTYYNATTTKAAWTNFVNSSNLKTLFGSHWINDTSYVPNPGDIIGYGTSAGSLNRFAIVDRVENGFIDAIDLNRMSGIDSNADGSDDYRGIGYDSFAIGSDYIYGYAAI